MKNTLKWFIICLLFGNGLVAFSKSNQPNIVVLFSDDAGYADFGFQGSTYFKTPLLDSMCAQGVKLEQMYVTAAVCGPSRAGLLTGKYQQRFGYEENNVPGYMSESSRLLGDDMGLPVGIPTIGDYLQELGYRTAYFGKWHMGGADRYHPLKRGFDEFVGFRGGARSFYAYENIEEVDHDKWMERGFKQYEEAEVYLTDHLANETCDFIDRSQDRPFFAFVSFNAVHTPMEPDPKFKDMYPELKGKRRKLAQMTHSLDLACGQIYEKLEALGLLENTLIVYTNDNGGPTDASRANNFPLSGTKANHLEGGIRVPGFVVWKGQLDEGKHFSYPVSTLDLLPTFVEVAGGSSDEIEGLDGVDVIPYLKGKTNGRPHDVLYWKKENRGVIRKGDWKLLRFPDRPAELYDIAADPREHNDLASENPELVRELYKELFGWECELDRPLFQLKRLYEGKAMKRMDTYRNHDKDAVE